MPTIGTDCHLTLKHDDLNGGAAYGFLLDPASRYPEGLRSIAITSTHSASIAPSDSASARNETASA